MKILKHICDYGCGQEALYPPRKGKNKWTCDENYQQCPILKKKNRISNLGKVRSIDTKRKMSLKATERLKSRSLREKISRKLMLKLPDFEERYPFFCKVEKPRENFKGDIEIECKLCREWFVPNRTSLFERIRQLEHPLGNGGGYLYCSDECKCNCPLYHLKSDPNKKVGTHRISGEDLKIWREFIIERDKHCQYCGNSNISELELHHIIPISKNPYLALDPSNGLTVCGRFSINKCHNKLHREECSPSKLHFSSC